MSNRDDEKSQQSGSTNNRTFYIIISIICFILCIFGIIMIVNWYWKSQVISQSLAAGRPGIAAAALSSGNSHYNSGYGYGHGYSRPLISIGSPGRGWGRGWGRRGSSSGRGSSGRSGRGRR